MKNKSLSLHFFFFFFLFQLSLPASATYIPRDALLLSCGRAASSVDSTGRMWLGDVGSKFFNPELSSLVRNVESNDSSTIPRIPYLAARVFDAQFTYSFPLAPGRIFLRLHFYPYDYGHGVSNAIFSVTAGSTTLLHNFSAYEEAAKIRNAKYFFLEYSIDVATTGQALDLTFTPSKDYIDAYAFVNGIEIVSMPDIFDTKTIDPNSALQTAYRLNVGGRTISPVADSGLFRTWEEDTPYVQGEGYGVSYSADPNMTIRYSRPLGDYIAPVDVYATARSMGPSANVNLMYNLTWALPVNSGFTYMVRLHFCEIQSEFTKQNMRVFNVYIDHKIVAQGFDVVVLTGGPGVASYVDYCVNGSTGAGTITVELQPDVSSKPEYYDVILNGLEVFKLQDGNSSLAGPTKSTQD